MWRRVLYVLVGVSSTACAATTTASHRPMLRHASRDAITATEIVAARVTDVYQAVVQLRPEFLRRPVARPMRRGVDSVAVYLDDLLVGTEESLKSIPLEQVRLIRFMRKSEADLRWGRAHPAGAILVTTLKR